MNYIQIDKDYVILKGNDTTLNEVWDVYTIQKVPYPNWNNKVEGKQRGGISEDKKKTSQGRLQTRKKHSLENDVENNLSLSL